MRDIERLVDLYDRRVIGRRELLAGLVMIGVGRTRAATAQASFQGRTLNHVSLGVTDLARSKNFYQRLLGVPVRDEGSDYCEFRLENAFFGLYKQPGVRDGIDHVAIGVAGYNPAVALEKLKREFPRSTPWLESEEQVYFHDPDGAKVQLTATDYKR
jgi:catechol 2,3-dioxygenase-like lactoylglutathione lyase family enzyme